MQNSAVCFFACFVLLHLAPESHLLEQPHVSSSPEKYLVLVLRLNANRRSLYLVKVTEAQGKLVVRKGPSSKFVYQVSRDGGSWVVGFLPEDPFVQRGFGSSDHYESRNPISTATITIDVPDADFQAAKDGRLGIKVYALNSTTKIEDVSPGILKQLMHEKKVNVRFELSRIEFASQLKHLYRK